MDSNDSSRDKKFSFLVWNLYILGVLIVGCLKLSVVLSLSSVSVGLGVVCEYLRLHNGVNGVVTGTVYLEVTLSIL